MREKKPSFKFIPACACVLLLAGYGLLRYVTPAVTIVNRTADKVIYVSFMQYVVSDDEPSDAEIAQIKRVWKIQPGRESTFPVFLSTLLSPAPMRYSPDWRVGSRVSSEATGVGGQTFSVERQNGAGEMRIEIDDDSFKVIPVKKFYSYKGLAPVNARAEP